MNSFPKISIITPNFNYGQYIHKLMESIIIQNYPSVEHIIVDDGSTDNSVQIINEFISVYPDKIKLMQQENKGQTNALNKALGMVSGDIIGWINSDDLYCPDSFNSIVSAFNKYDNCDAIFGNILIIDQTGNTIKYNKYLNFDYASGVFIGFGKIISSNAIFWRSNLTKEAGSFNENFRIGMDSEYWSRLLFKKKVKHINVPIACFRWHPDAKTIKRQNKSNHEYIFGLNENAEVFKKTYPNLKISKMLPDKYSTLIKYYYKIKRYILRFINGHYFG